MFLHGWGADSRSFVMCKNFFGEYSQIYVDFAGFGASPEPDRPYSVKDYATELKELLDSFEIDELILVGHSFGGRVAIKFAFLFQNEYKSMKICLVDSAGIRPKLNLIRRLKVKKFKWLRSRAEGNPRLQEKLSQMGSSDYIGLSPIMKQTFNLVINEDLSAQAKFIRCPTCIIWGSKDKETKMYMARKFCRLIKNSELHIIRGAGHFSFVDNFQEFLILLDTFIKN